MQFHRLITVTFANRSMCIYFAGEGLSAPVPLMLSCFWFLGLLYASDVIATDAIVLQASDKHSPSMANPGRVGRRPGSGTTSTSGRADAPLFAGNMQGGLSNKYAGESHLKDPLDPRCVFVTARQN